MFCYIEIVTTVSNVIIKLHAILHGTGYLTCVVSAVGFDGKVMNNW